jgi:hypothetical protein
MNPLMRFLSWMVAIGNREAAFNARGAVEDRLQAEAAVDALSARLAGDEGSDTPSRAA